MDKLLVNHLWELKGKKNVQEIYMFLQFLWQSGYQLIFSHLQLALMVFSIT